MNRFRLSPLVVFLAVCFSWSAADAQLDVIYKMSGTDADYKASDWYQGGGANFFTVSTPSGESAGFRSGGNGSHDFGYNTVFLAAPATNNFTGMAFGPVMTVNDEAGELSLPLVGGGMALQFTGNNLSVTQRQTSGGVGFALWDLTTGDYVRDGDGKVQTAQRTMANGNTLDTKTISLAGLEGHSVMLVAIDRQRGDWGWVGVGDISATFGAITVQSTNPALVVQNYHFDTADNYMGWKEYAVADAYNVEATPAAAIVNFRNGLRGSGNARNDHYIDNSGTIASGKGFLSSGGQHKPENESSGVLRSPAFLCQADIFEFYINGGNLAGTLELQLVLAADVGDQVAGTVLYSTTGSGNSADQQALGYDFTSVQQFENLPVFIQLYDNATGSWGHLEVDQLRMVDFAPSTAKSEARANALTLSGTAPLGTEAVFNVYAWNADGIGSVADMQTFLSQNTAADSGLSTDTLKFANQTWGDAAKSVVLHAETAFEVPYSGFYTFAVDANSGFALSIDGTPVFEGEGETDPYLHTVFFEEAGVYSLSLDYFDVDGLINLELFAAVGDHEAWDAAAFSSFGSVLPGTAFGFDMLADPMSAFGVSPQDAGAGVPEPATWLLMLFGTAAMFVARRRR